MTRNFFVVSIASILTLTAINSAQAGDFPILKKPDKTGNPITCPLGFRQMYTIKSYERVVPSYQHPSDQIELNSIFDQLLAFKLDLAKEHARFREGLTVKQPKFAAFCIKVKAT